MMKTIDVIIALRKTYETRVDWAREVDRCQRLVETWIGREIGDVVPFMTPQGKMCFMVPMTRLEFHESRVGARFKKRKLGPSVFVAPGE